MTLLVLLGHVGFDALFGWALFSLGRNEQSGATAFPLSVLVGIYVETLCVATLLFLGISLVAAGIATAVAMAALMAAALYLRKLRFGRFFLESPRWYEWAVLAAIVEKVAFAVWQLGRTHTYFDDALTHWSGRARSLYGGFNWSFDPASPVFLGQYIGSRNYPLQTIIWRALSAKLNGGWNEILSRADGVIFFVVLLATIWLAVQRFSNIRWLAAAAVFIVAAVPLHVWHAAAGYSDIAVEAFVVASLAAILRAEWLIAGVMAAGAVWSKNDSLVLYVPALVAAVSVIRWRSLPRFAAGFATIAPWLIFNVAYRLGISPGEQSSQIGWHSEALQFLWDVLAASPTSGILWICVLACAILTGPAMFKDSVGRGLILAFSISLAAILFTFTSTGAFTFLKDATTINRVMMQFSGMAVLAMTYGLWMKIRSTDSSSSSVRSGRKTAASRAV